MDNTKAAASGAPRHNASGSSQAPFAQPVASFVAGATFEHLPPAMRRFLRPPPCRAKNGIMTDHGKNHR
jgi:hypothetical protein